MNKYIPFLIILLLFTGCSKNQGEPYSLSDKDRENINSYLELNFFNPRLKNGKIISVFDVLGSNKNQNEIYVWILIEEVYIEGGQVKRTTGLSQPLVIKVEEENGEIIVKGNKSPRDGEKFNSDINNLFPVKIREIISTYNKEHLEKQLEDKIKMRYQF
ncbi:hypothetical protein D1B31_18135 [Neobacillus notoginsengisoli]|uniref:Lipoprotein n=1 Tax=Neobacillus notoginsengisoli TaxID=1578198 RepID=A0A417YPX0_9BACI|nr:hypothetical protein [Neobacillus notoginsengisoli]RHW36008.1 hypothetical protein D1B31_18135 [Neobacillus notoginsengisoli]